MPPMCRRRKNDFAKFSEGEEEKMFCERVSEEIQVEKKGLQTPKMKIQETTVGIATMIQCYCPTHGLIFTTE